MGSYLDRIREMIEEADKGAGCLKIDMGDLGSFAYPPSFPEREAVAVKVGAGDISVSLILHEDGMPALELIFDAGNGKRQSNLMCVAAITDIFFNSKEWRDAVEGVQLSRMLTK